MEIITTNTSAPFNKRQFWEYKRLYGGITKRNNNIQNNASSISTLTANNTTNNTSNTTTNTTTNTKPTKKIFHIVNNKVATDKELIDRLASIYIPPAYKNVVVAKSSNNKIQAIGTDNRGRRQYIYNTQYTKKRNDRKYEDIIELGKNISLIEKDNNMLLNELVKKKSSQWVLPDDYIPIIIYMLRKYHFRIGNELYAKMNNSYGITTLRKEHILWDTKKPDSFKIEFIGKKNIVNSFSDTNPLMAKLLKILSQQAQHNTSTSTQTSTQTNTQDYLFKYIAGTGLDTSSPRTATQNNNNDNDNNSLVFITPDQIQTYFQEKYNSYITPKMFRTWYGNKHLLECLRDMFNAGELTGKTHHKMNMSERQYIIKKCSEYVSSKLNNTPSVSKTSYIDNKILELVLRNPYRFAKTIPDDNNAQHNFLYKIILRLRHK